MAPKTILLILHVLGVVWGVGGVLMLDVHLLRHLRGADITQQDERFTHFVSAFVKAGLIVVWVSGLAVIGIAPDGPAAVLANPKLQAKLVVVVVLTINALFVETLALPLIARNVGRPLFDGVGQVRRSVILGCGAVSTLSWSYPVALGLARELNQTTPAQVILTYYVALLACVAAALQVAGRLLYRPVGRPAAGAPADERAVALPSTGTAPGGIADGREGGALEAAQRAGHSALDAAISRRRTADVFASLGTEQERQRFRAGLFAALRERFGRDRTIEELVAAVAADELLRDEVEAVAPRGAARGTSNAGGELASQQSEDAKWSTVQEWHESLMNINAPAAAPGEAGAARAA